jgi:hypothetical protein
MSFKERWSVKRFILHLFPWLMIAVGILACAATRETWRLPDRHPDVDQEDLRFCMECHEESDENIRYSRYSHTPLFAENHRSTAQQNPAVCSMCHAPRFCGTCHGVGIELKPSVKDPTGTFKRTPHRGDYLARHRVDGRIDPVSCRRCHGSPKTVASCSSCHG